MTAFTFTAYPGQKVVCINAARHRDWPADLLIHNKVYTVAAIAPTGGLFLAEAPWLAPYKRSRFRPVQAARNEAGMGILRSILDNPAGFEPTPTPDGPKVPEVEEEKEKEDVA